MATEYIEKQAARPDEFCVGVSCQECPFLKDPLYGGCRVDDFIMALPPADVQPVRRGRWEEVKVTWLADVEDQPDAIASMFCPECRRFANHVYHYGDPRYGMNFCPWCGARMGGD